MRRRMFLALTMASCLATKAGAVTPMSDDRFWTIMDRTATLERRPDAQSRALHQELASLSAEDVAAFDAAFERQMQRAYSWRLWGAAYIANGGCSDDGFVYFRLWLISKGRRVFDAVLQDPDALADFHPTPGPDGVYEFEAFGYVAREVLAQKGVGEGAGLPDGDPGDPSPAGEPFQDAPAWLAAHYPKLWKRFGTHPRGS